MALRALLDTNAFFENKWRKSEPMKTFANLCRAGSVQCFLPHVVFREITSQGIAHQTAQIAALNAAMKNLKKYALPSPQYEMLSQALANLDENKDAVLTKVSADFQAWCKSISAAHIPISAHHAESVLNSYFSGAAPFKQLKSREDFPDAFIYEIVKDLADKPLLVVCNDDNLRRSCEDFPNVKAFKSVHSFLAHPEIAALIIKAPDQEHSRHVGFAEAFDSASGEAKWVDTVRQRLASAGSRSEQIRNELTWKIIDELTRTQVESRLIASDNHTARVLSAALGDIQFSLAESTYYGDGKFGFNFEADSALLLQYYVDEYATGRVRGKVMKSVRVYKDVEQFETEFNARIFGRATIQIAASPETLLGGIKRYEFVAVDEIQQILLSDDPAL